MKSFSHVLKPTRQLSKIGQHPGALLVLVAFVVLAIVYSLDTPPFEAGDESRHYAVVKFMADTGRLPVQEAGEAQIHWSHEGNQPPLYYALAAVLTAWIDTGSWDDVYWYNPHTTIGNPLRPDNKNITIHPPGAEWPWRGFRLAVHLIRFLSIAMATVTVSVTYTIALRLFKDNRWLAAGTMAITAFNPMFIFISASVNNDNAVIMFATLALWLMVKVINDPCPSYSHSPTKVAALLGLLIGLGALSKLYALGLLPLAVFFFLWLAYKNRPSLTSSRFWRTFLLWNLVMLVTFAVVAGWFYFRNARLYDGDMLALQIMRNTAGQRQEIPTLATLRAEFKGFRIAYWALFGGVNILADDWIYTVLDWVSLVAVVGVVAFIGSSVTQHAATLDQSRGTLATPNRSPASWMHSPSISNLHAKRLISTPTFILLLAWYFIVLAGFIAWNLTQPAGQGRLLYPAVAAISALGMMGLTWWLPPLAQKIVVGLCTVGLFTFALLSPFLYIAPAYARPPILTEADLPPDLQPVNFSYNGQMRLIGYKLQADTLRPAETLPLTLYWQVLQPTDLDYSIFVHLLGRQRRVVGQIDTYPGRGEWPTTLLKPDDILADHYEIRITPQAEIEDAPTKLLITAGIYDLNEPGRPGKPATDAAGQPVEPLIASAKLIPWHWPNPPRQETPINFSDKATLLSHQITDNQRSVRLNWQVNQPFDTDYTVFIQAWPNDHNEQVAGFDGPPVQGDYPTSLWAPGEIVVDTHPIDLSGLSPGTYYLLAGLYDPATGERLPAVGAAGPLPDDAVNLGTVQVGQ